MIYRTLLFLLVVLLPVLLRAEVIVAPDTHSFNLARDVAVLRDAPTDLTVDQLRMIPWQSRFTPQDVTGTALNLGQISGVVWLRIDLQVQPGAERDWVLDIPYGNLNAIEWFVFQQSRSGYVLASEMAPPLFNYRYHAQPLELDPGPVTLYARIVAHGPMTLPLELQTESIFLIQEGKHLFIQALYFGALAVLLLYAMLFAWSIKDAAYLVFSAYLLASGFAIFVGNGLARLFL